MTAPTMPVLPGFTAVQHLGSGGYADVYLYEQHAPKRRVAIKVLRDQALSPKLVDQFTSEANAMAELAHPHIVPVYSAGQAPDGRPYIAMMYYPPPSLAERSATERFGVSDVLRIGIQIGSAIETAHRADILHRDIKPANILVSPYGQPGLTDFGIAARIAEADDDDQGLSVPWSPPEVVFGTSPARPSSDVYSLAATLWHLLVGRSPFENPGNSGNSQWDLMQRIRDLPAPSTGLPIPASLDRLLRQTMAKDPAQRPRRAMDFVMALQAIEQEERLPRTEAVVLDERSTPGASPTPQPGTPSRGTDSTRLKGPIRVDPTRAASPPPVATAADAGATPETRQRATRVTGGPDSEGSAATQRRVGSGTQSGARPVRRDPAPAEAPTMRRHTATGSAETTPQEAPVGRARYGVFALAAGLLIVAAVVGLLLTQTGRGQVQATATTPAVTANPGSGGDALPPGPVTVKAARADGSVTFTWSYSAAYDSDTFLWRSQDGRVTGKAEKAAYTVDLPAGTAMCLQVKVVRADGSNASPTWSAPGCAP
jgi:serine/threonine protein kinase